MEYDWKEQQPYAYWLHCVPGIGSKSMRELTEYAGSPQAVYEMSYAEWKMLLAKKKADILQKWRKETEPKRFYEAFTKGQIRYIPMGHPEYPKRLVKIEDKPYGIFVLGRLPQNDKPAVAVIGARQCSEYGKYIANQCAMQLAHAGINVISGMARGIDGIAHEAALRAGGETYGVLGCGVDVCYPAENRRLYENIRKSGGVLSEYIPGTQPKAGLFPMRNRIISALSDVVLIVEARERSGTLITADMALEQGKDVYVVPGRVTDSLSLGCNQLIRQGAGIMISVEEMLKETGLLTKTIGEWGKGQIQQEYNEKQEKDAKSEIWNYLDYYPKSIECLQQESGMEYRQLLLQLTELCIEQHAVQVSANQYAKKDF